MKYEKPELKMIASAIDAVKGTGKGDDTPMDGDPNFVTISAYEVDE